MTETTVQRPRVVSREEWTAARTALLAREKEATRVRDALAAERRALPMVEVTEEYAFQSPRGTLSLADLFEGRSQLLVYHFMFDPEWTEGCSGCSHLADNFGGLAHLHARDTTLVMVSRAPLSTIQPFQRRMGWTVPWVSSYGSRFNYDFHVTTDPSIAPVKYNYRDAATLEEKGEMYHARGEQPGLSAFLREDGRVYHTYSTYGRGLEDYLNTYRLLDATPRGRQEGWGGMPDLGGLGMGWLRHHDRYEPAAGAEPSACECRGGGEVHA